MTVGSICTGLRAVLVSGGGPVRWQSRGGVAEAWQLGAAVSEVARAAAMDSTALQQEVGCGANYGLSPFKYYRG